MAVDLTCNPEVSVYDGLGRRLKKSNFLQFGALNHFIILENIKIYIIYGGFKEKDVIFMLLPWSRDSVPVYLFF